MDPVAILGDRWLRTERAYSKVPSRSLPLRPRRGPAFTSHGSRNHTGSRRRGLGKTLLVSCLLIVVSLSARGLVSTATSSLQIHDPIVISSNSDFNPSNGVTGGSGTASDPYVIEGWNITSSGTTGISISNTDASFVIRNVYINHLSGGSGSPTPYGVNMTNVSNGAIEASRIYNFYNSASNLAVVMSLVNDVVLNNVTVMPSTILITNSTHVAVSHSTAYRIDVKESLAVQVSNNDAHLGIDVSSSTNVTITDNQSNTPGIKIGVEFSSNIIITGNSFACDCLPISVQNSNHVTIIGNNLNGNEADAVVNLANSDFIDVSDNKISGDSAAGIVLSSCIQATIKGNQLSPLSDGFAQGAAVVEVSGSHLVNISDNTIAPSPDMSSNLYRYPYPEPLLKVSLSSNITISGNNLSNSTTAVSFVKSSNATITGNNIQSNTQGLILNNTVNIQIFHNNFLNNDFQAQDTNSTQNIWDNGYPSGGNFWSDYTGVDNCSGPQQNTCPGPDGIGDTPYTFNNNQDNYPLMQLFVPDPPAAAPVAQTATSGGGGGGGLHPLHV